MVLQRIIFLVAVKSIYLKNCVRSEKTRYKFVFILFSTVFVLWLWNHVINNYANHYPDQHPKSPLYGMNHRATYGLPLTQNTVFSRNWKDEKWEEHFKNLFVNLNLLKKANPSEEKQFFTKSFLLLINKTSYNLGEKFVSTIISNDGEGKPKTFGGDYYRARLIRSNANFPDGIPCEIVDNGDGSYTVTAPLTLEGQLILDVTLVISVEGINEIIKNTSKFASWGHKYLAELETKEIVECNVDLSTIKIFQQLPMCDYSNPRNKESWVCVKPSSGNCSKITSISYTKVEANNIIDFDSLCSKYNCHLRAQHQFISVADVDIRKRKNYFKQLPACKNVFPSFYQNMDTSGFIQNGVWSSIDCKNKFTSLGQIRNCFIDKVVYFIGDSTIRQYFSLAVSALKLTVTGSDDSKLWQQPKIGRDGFIFHYNSTLYYRAHGPPLQNPGPPNTRPYISDLIEDIPVGGKDVYVIFNIGAHLYHYNPNIYLHRLKGIKEAILNHHKRFPKTKFIVRGLNVVIFSFEFNIYRFEKLLFDTFKNMPNVMYLNMWDLTTIWPLTDYHPVKKILEQQALYMFRNICS